MFLGLSHSFHHGVLIFFSESLKLPIYIYINDKFERTNNDKQKAPVSWHMKSTKYKTLKKQNFATSKKISNNFYVFLYALLQLFKHILFNCTQCGSQCVCLHLNHDAWSYKSVSLSNLILWISNMVLLFKFYTSKWRLSKCQCSGFP